MCQIEWHSELTEEGQQLDLGSKGIPSKLEIEHYRIEMVKM